MGAGRAEHRAPDIQPLRAFFDSCCVGGAQRGIVSKEDFVRDLPSARTAVAFFGLSLEVVSHDGSYDARQKMIGSIDEALSGNQHYSWDQFAGSAVPTAILASLRARCMFAAEAIAIAAESARDESGAELISEHCLQAVAAARAAAFAVAPPASQSGEALTQTLLTGATKGEDLQDAQRRFCKVSQELEDTFEQQLRWAEATERAVHTALIQAQSLGAKHGLALPTRQLQESEPLAPQLAQDAEPIHSDLQSKRSSHCAETCDDALAIANNIRRHMISQVDRVLADLAALAHGGRSPPGTRSVEYEQWAQRATMQLQRVQHLLRDEQPLSQAALLRVNSCISTVSTRVRECLQPQTALPSSIECHR